MIVPPSNLAARRANANATLGQVVAGHGGDVYWATHEDGSRAPYCFTDFELELLGFGAAQELLFDSPSGGWIACRASWPAEVFVAHMAAQVIEPAKLTASTRRLVEAMTAEPRTMPLRVAGYFVIFTAEGEWQPGWVPAQEDRDAADWRVVQPEMALPAVLTRR